MEREEGDVGEVQPPNIVNNAQATDEATGMDPAHAPGTAAFVETYQTEGRSDDSALGASAIDSSTSSQGPGMVHVFQPTSEDYDRCMALTILSIAAYIYRCVRRRVEIPWQPPYGNDDNVQANDDALQEETGYWSLGEDFNPFQDE
ncbi:uncharacterized protein LOC124280582 isoform X1 [Haliotis rubra]|uniref:uncharacterized protein LOC124280582 isoform X1 n=1 Tax=Haliotis rubra TaxID=36100 RepID=UPI001EE57C6E|nr:uncharacterized protein LOC124280582 isoform X1 [Haliotis rubra]